MTIAAHYREEIMEKIIIGLVGRMGSGKSTVSEIILERREGVIFKFSDVLYDTLGLYGLERSTKNLQLLSTMLRQNFGENLLANVMAKKIRDTAAELVVVDGVRREVDVAALKDLEDKNIRFVLFFIHRSQQDRFNTIQENRNEKTDDKTTWEEFQEKDTQECESQIGMLRYIPNIYTCDVDNNGDLEQLKGEVETKLQEIISKI
jgi:dephospho-CoA kinase